MKRISYFLTILLLFPLSHARAHPVPAPDANDVRALFARSDVVCSGHVTDVAQQGYTQWHLDGTSAPATKRIATVAVRRLYKGPSSTARINVVFADPGHAITSQLPVLTLERGDFALLFLKNENGELTFADPWFSKQAMSAILGSAGTSGLDLLEDDLDAGLADPDSKEVAANLELLAAFRQLRSTRNIAKLADTSGSDLQGAALSTLLTVKDYSRLRQALQIVQQQPNTRLPAYAMRILIGVRGISDRSTIPVLLGFVQSNSNLVRNSVAASLRRMNDPRTVPALVSMLDDANPDTRYDAAFTLATIEGKQNTDWINSFQEFQRNENGYIQKWKSWWQTEGSEKYARNTH